MSKSENFCEECGYFDLVVFEKFLKVSDLRMCRKRQFVYHPDRGSYPFCITADEARRELDDPSFCPDWEPIK